MEQRPTLLSMKLPRRRDRSSKAEIGGLGLDSIRFDTLGLTRRPDVAPNHRYWLGANLGLGEYWFPGPPDPLTLDEDEIRATYEGLMGAPADADGLTPLLLHIAVHLETPVPVVCALTRLPDDHRYTFVGAITVLLTECSWVIKVQSRRRPDHRLERGPRLRSVSRRAPHAKIID